MVKLQSHKLHKEPVSNSKILLKFTAKEFSHTSKNDLWYAGISLLALAVIFVAWQIQDYSLIVVVVALTMVVFKVINIKPKAFEFCMTTRGIYFGENFYGYHNLRSFWIAKTGNEISLYIDRLNLSSTLKLLVPENQIKSLIDHLDNYLPWHTHKKEPIAEKFGRFLGI